MNAFEPFLAGTVVILAALSGCVSPQTTQPPSMALDEARSVALSIKAFHFDLQPPRTTEDILALLSRYSPPPHRLTPMPSNLPREARLGAAAAREYTAEAGDASWLGRFIEHVEFSRLAAEAAKGQDLEFSKLVDYSYAQYMVMGMARSIATRDQAIKVARRYGHDAMIGAALLIQSMSYSYLGDTRTARALVEEAKVRYKRARSTDLEGAKWWIDAWDADQAFYPGVLLMVEGKFSEARTEFIKAIAAQERNIRRNAERIKHKIPSHPQHHVEIWIAMMHTHLAECLAMERQYSAAESEMRKGLVKALRIAGNRAPFVAVVLTRYALMLYGLGRYAEAFELADRSANMFSRGGAQPSNTVYLEARRIRAEANAAQGRWGEAVIDFDAMESDVLRFDDKRLQSLLGGVAWGLAMIRTEQATRALPMLEDFVRHTTERYGSGHYAAAEARCVWGMALAETGNKVKALQEMRTCMAIFAQELPRKDPSPAQRTHLEAIVDAYLGLLLHFQGGDSTANGFNAAEEAFLVAELVRHGRVQHSTIAGAIRNATDNADLRDLLRQEQDTARHIDLVESLLATQARADTDSDLSSAQADLKSRLARLRDAQHALQTALAQRYPKYYELSLSGGVTLKAVRGALREGEALIAMLAGERQTYLWGLDHKTLVFAAAPIGRFQLAQKIQSLRQPFDTPIADVDDLLPFDVSGAWEVHRTLMEPLKSIWGPARTILTVAGGAVAQLPLGILVTRKSTLPADHAGVKFSAYRKIPWLARTHGTVSLPSLATLTLQRSIPPAPGPALTFAGVGDPYFTPEQLHQETASSGQSPVTRGAFVRRNLLVKRVAGASDGDAEITAVANSSRLAQVPPLPETADELRDIARALGADEARDLYLGRRANEKMVKDGALANRRIITFATHGLMAGELDGLDQPALALSSPLVTGDDENDGLLTMGEIFGLSLQADWVVLSACNTAAGDRAGSEFVSGLGRAFFYAGAKALLVTHWAVESTSASMLTTGVFRAIRSTAGLSHAEALKTSINALIDSPGYLAASGKPLFGYSHPFFWAPFSLVGAPR